MSPPPNSRIEDYPDTRQQSMMINIFIPPDETNPEKTFLSVICQVVETSYVPTERIPKSSLVTVQSTRLSYM